MLKFSTEKSITGYTHNLTETYVLYSLLASYQDVVVKLRTKKQQISKIRRIHEKELENAKSTFRHSKSGLASIDRKTTAANEELSDVSLVLNQKLAQKDSILRLIQTATQQLVLEKEAKEQAEQDVEFAENDDDKKSFQIRLSGILGRISDIELGIKNRQKVGKKLEGEINTYSLSKDKLFAKIKKTNQTKPELKKLLKDSQKDVVALSEKLEKSIKQEASAKKTLKKAEDKLKEISSKKRQNTKRSKSKKTSVKKPVKKATKPAKRVTKKPAKRVTKKPAKRVTKKPAKRVTKKPAKRVAKHAKKTTKSKR